MAIVRSLAIGKARNSAGNLTYQTVKGRTIAREKPAFVSNPDTPAQRAQRAKMTTVVEAWRAWFAALAPFFTAIKGYGSAYNEFVSRNIALARNVFFDPVSGKLSMGQGITCSTGKYGVNALAVKPTQANIHISVADIQLRGDMRVNDRIILVSQGNEDELPVITEQVLTQPLVDLLAGGGETTIANPSTGDSFSFAVFFYSSARGIASTGVTVNW